MKLYKTKSGVVIEQAHQFFLVPGESWDHFINDDHIVEKVKALTTILPAGGETLISEVMAPIGDRKSVV